MHPTGMAHVSSGSSSTSSGRNRFHLDVTASTWAQKKNCLLPVDTLAKQHSTYIRDVISHMLSSAGIDRMDSAEWMICTGGAANQLALCKASAAHITSKAKHA